MGRRDFGKSDTKRVFRKNRSDKLVIFKDACGKDIEIVAQVVAGGSSKSHGRERKSHLDASQTAFQPYGAFSTPFCHIQLIEEINK